jgi:hypothetical protein
MVAFPISRQPQFARPQLMDEAGVWLKGLQLVRAFRKDAALF